MSKDSDRSDVSFNAMKSMALAVPPDSPKKPVKSTAVEKYSAVQTPVTYAQFQCNTDLNFPLSNWLNSSAESYSLQNVWSQNTGFHSFHMAHIFSDYIDEVDVVSDAENIKKLFKLPYNHEMISMVVHRIANTLLLDFDIHKYLLRQAKSDWEWLKKFFYEHIFQNVDDKEKRLFHKAYSRNSLQQRNLVSKFLYQSIVLEDTNKQNEKPQLPVKTLEPCSPEPTQEEKVPDPNYNHNFARNVVWTFENIQILIKTDMPIFGGQTHPCISLRLRDMSKPINVLTGIDYWLDNLMCNVPEVVMCYHLDGIVQKYELIKTEDLPNMDASKFSLKVIRDIAQNILSFLKNNAMKAGHTYWLFKGKDDDVVKLYDLTSLCSDVTEEKGQNSFTVPVAMLLYRVARNMKYSPDYHRHQGTIRMLLKNCVELLAKEKYPQIVTSAHLMFSDLYIPSDTHPACPGLSDQSDEEDIYNEYSTNQENEKEEEEQKEEKETCAAIKFLTLAKTKKQIEREQPKYKAPPISGTIEERCLSGLEHVIYGLECVRYFPTEDNSDEEQKKAEELEKEKQKYEEMHPNVAKSFQAIPMFYALNQQNNNDTPEEESGNFSPIHKKKNKQKKKKKNEKNITKEIAIENALLCKPKVETLPTWQASKKGDNICWRAHLKTLLYEKASLIFAVLAEKEYVNKNYGASLRYMLEVLYCQKILEIFCGIRNDKSISYLLGRAGDCCFMIVHDWNNVEKHRKDYETKNETEEKIVEELFSMGDLDMNGAELLPKELESPESTLVSSYKCYEKALSLEPIDGMERRNLLRNLGDIHNELGVLYMNVGIQYQQEESLNSAGVTAFLTRSFTHFESGVKAFETVTKRIVHDEENLALLHSNIGRVIRLCADGKQNTQKRSFYNKALERYQKAVQVLGSRKKNPALWDSVMWDLSTTLYTIATELQDYPTAGSKTEMELEREVVDILQKALKHCDIDTPGPLQPICQFRAATIQHRLASLYHRVYREFESVADSNKKKTSLQLCKLYYDKAATLLLSLEESSDYLTVQMERVALAEYQACNSTTFNNKLKAYQNGLDLILQCIPIMEALLCERNNAMKQKDAADNRIENTHRAECEKNAAAEQKLMDDEENLVVLLKQRLQFLLRSVTKLFFSNKSPKNKKKHETLANLYKQCYVRTLRPDTMSGSTFIKHVTELLRELDCTLKQAEF